MATGNVGGADALFKLKLSVDVREAKNFKVSANIYTKFSV